MSEVKTMKFNKRLLFIFMIGILPFSAIAYRCPVHINAAQAQIDNILLEMKQMDMKVDKSEMALVHSLIDYAKMYLHSATHNHEKPQGLFDHARSIAKADSALAYANAATSYYKLLVAKAK